MTPRAPALSTDERRHALVAATIPLLRQKGAAVTTREIAAAAGVAEGTIFRVFDTKDALIQEAVQAAFDPTDVIEQLAAIDVETPLADRVSAVIEIIRDRFRRSFDLMRMLGATGPPAGDDGAVARLRDSAARLEQAATDVLASDAEHLTIPPGQLATLCRMLAFTTENPHLTDDHDYSSAVLASLLLDGARRRRDETCS